MADAKDEILHKLDALTTAIDLKLDALTTAIDRGFYGVNAKLDDIRNDIQVISKAHLAPLEQKKILTGSSPNWPRPIDVDDLKEG